MTTEGRQATDANARAWEAVLDRLERDVEAIEELARAADGVIVAPTTVPWEPPDINGPLPDHLLQRAREIHHRQTVARRDLAEAMAANRVDADRVTPRSTATPVSTAYVDVSA